MSLSSFFTKAAATKTVRVATVPALAAAAVALAAGPALAADGPHGFTHTVAGSHSFVRDGRVGGDGRDARDIRDTHVVADVRDNRDNRVVIDDRDNRDNRGVRDARVASTSAFVSHGLVTVRGYYQCARSSRSAELQVTVVGQDRRGRAEGTRDVRVDCADSPRAWSLTVAPSRRGDEFTPGVVRVDASLWAPRGHVDSSNTLFARGY